VRDAVICEPLRTAVGGFGGGLRTVGRVVALDAGLPVTVTGQ
jgi:hypothetical protein